MIQLTSTGHGGVRADFGASYAVSCQQCGATFRKRYMTEFSLVNGEVVFYRNGYAEAFADWNRRASFREEGQD